MDKFHIFVPFNLFFKLKLLPITLSTTDMNIGPKISQSKSRWCIFITNRTFTFPHLFSNIKIIAIWAYVAFVHTDHFIICFACFLLTSSVKNQTWSNYQMRIFSFSWYIFCLRIVKIIETEIFRLKDNQFYAIIVLDFVIR